MQTCWDFKRLGLHHTRSMEVFHVFLSSCFLHLKTGPETWPSISIQYNDYVFIFGWTIPLKPESIYILLLTTQWECLNGNTDFSWSHPRCERTDVSNWQSSVASHDIILLPVVLSQSSGTHVFHTSGKDLHVSRWQASSYVCNWRSGSKSQSVAFSMNGNDSH